MIFPNSYKCLNQNEFRKDNYKIVPLRYEDRMDIMKWRNEQMYHLRQVEVLTQQSQDNYFKNTVSKLFENDKPSQILFSYLKNGNCIGYGGLVHISYEKQSAEVSFIMETSLEENEFEIHWSTFLKMIGTVAFKELKFKNIFTYAYNLRPHLYPVLENNRFSLKSRLKDEIGIDGKKIDVLIHERKNPFYFLQIRESDERDMELIYNWSNDSLVRNQSFSQEPIEFDSHKKWYDNKLKSGTSLLLINEYEGSPSGLIRFEVQEDNSTVGILIGKEYRGKGLASDMLLKSSNYYFSKFDKPILAFIKESNKASIKSFTNAGFEFSHTTKVNEFPTLVYKLQKK